MALSERPDLIIMDVMMPCGNGMRALRALRQCPATAGIPVIMTSGFHVPSPDDKAAGRADALLAKPFGVEELLSCVGRLLKG
jgi:CheY-like chemotaxis protein